MSNAPERFDVAIVGGGMVGAALAAACRDQGWRIALIDGQPPARVWPRGTVDQRVSALNRASQRLLERLGAWPRMAARGPGVYREMVVWNTPGGSIHFDSATVGEPDLGHIVENRVTRLALWELLEQTAAVTLFCPATIAALESRPTGMRLRLDDGRALEARLVVGADGRASRVRAALGIATRHWPHEQHAIVATVAVEHWHRETAWQRFLPTGPLAFLPLADGRCSIVWSARETLARRLLALDDAAFAARLEQAFERRLGAIRDIGPRLALPLCSRHADEYIRPRAAIIGDAAHAVHPLAGQGANLGLRDVAVLAAELARAARAGRDPGGPLGLRRHARARRGETLLTLRAMDALNRLFSNDHALLAIGRGAGLALVDRLTPLKRELITRALGLGREPLPFLEPR